MKNRFCALAALGACTAVSAWALNQTEVDVVSNLTAHGERVEHPTTAHPVYYLPVISGYMEPINPVGIGRETPPSIENVEHVVEAALAREGYHPSRPGLRVNAQLQVTYSDGTPVTVPTYPLLDRPLRLNRPGYDPLTVAMITSANGPYSFHMSQRVGPRHLPAPLIQVLRTIDPIHGPVLQGMPQLVLVIQWGELHAGVSSRPTAMLDLPVWVGMLAGDKFLDGSPLNINFRDLDEIVQRTSADRYFVMVTALDFKSCIGGAKNRIQLWRTRMSVPSNGFGMKYANMLPVMIRAGEGQLGRETGHPIFTIVPKTDEGNVTIGPLEVKDYQEAPAPLPDTGSDRFLPLHFEGNP